MACFRADPLCAWSLIGSSVLKPTRASHQVLCDSISYTRLLIYKTSMVAVAAGAMAQLHSHGGIHTGTRNTICTIIQGPILQLFKDSHHEKFGRVSFGSTRRLAATCTQKLPDSKVICRFLTAVYIRANMSWLTKTELNNAVLYSTLLYTWSLWAASSQSQALTSDATNLANCRWAASLNRLHIKKCFDLQLEWCLPSAHS